MKNKNQQERERKWEGEHKKQRSLDNKIWYQTHRIEVSFRRKARREANPEKFRKQKREWRLAHRNQANETYRNWCRSHRAQKIACREHWRKKNLGRCRLTACLRGRRYRKQLANPYVRSKLAQRSTIEYSEWPQELVNLKRQLILTRRMLNEISH